MVHMAKRVCKPKLLCKVTLPPKARERETCNIVVLNNSGLYQMLATILP